MFSAIASDPTVLPLWAVFLFAASMYPLGLLLPGCPCCSSGCTQCGVFSTGYASGQNTYGRMCCTGTIAPSVTLRITNVGAASSTYVTRGAGSPYTRTTYTYNCDAYVADYVIPLTRPATSTSAQCWWQQETGSLYAFISPVFFDFSAFPQWSLTEQLDLYGVSVTKKVQTCSGYPGPESCNIGTTTTESHTIDLVNTTSGPFFEQRCNLAGLLVSSSYPSTDTSVSGADTGCRMKVEFV